VAGLAEAAVTDAPLWRLAFTCPQELAEQAEDALLAAGAISISWLEDPAEPIFEPPPGTTPLWSSGRIEALFEQEDTTRVATLCEALGLAALEDCESAPLSGRDWVAETQAAFPPRRFGGAEGAGLWIVPSWHEIDPQALAATEYNAEANSIRLGSLYTALPDELPPLVADGLMANILANPLIELAPVLAARVRLGGWLLLSGILVEQAEAVREAYAPWFAEWELSVAHDSQEDQRGWVRLVARRVEAGPR